MRAFTNIPGIVCVRSAVVLAVACLAPPVHANEALARKSDCLGCHAVATKLVGPAYKDVAAKYAGQTDAQAVLMQSIRNGGAGKWGELPMPAHPKLSDADLKKLASWILGLK
jgi:cytochrome c